MGLCELTGREVSGGLCGFHLELLPNAIPMNDHRGQGARVQCWVCPVEPPRWTFRSRAQGSLQEWSQRTESIACKWWARKVRAGSEKGGGEGRALGGRQMNSPARETRSSRQRGQKKIQ